MVSLFCVLFSYSYIFFGKISIFLMGPLSLYYWVVRICCIFCIQIFIRDMFAKYFHSVAYRFVFLLVYFETKLFKCFIPFLKYSWFTVFLVYSKVNQKYIYIWSFFFGFLFPLLLFSHSVMSDSFLTPWTVATRLLWPWYFPGKYTGVGCHFLLQGIVSTQGLNHDSSCISCSAGRVFTI